jgi:outer membrane protein OmpA-like peptidoglycan-associated protein
VVGAGQLAVGCAADRGTLRSCRVTLTVRGPGGRALKIGGGTRSLRRTQRSTSVLTKLTSRGRAAIGRVGGATVTISLVSVTSDGRTLRSVRTVRLLPAHALAVPTDGLFATDSATLSAAGSRFLGTVASGLRAAKRIECVGYTDSSGSAAHNRALGLARAQAICGRLRHEGLDARLTTSSGGESHPRASNATEAGRARNRRVELRVSYS